MKSLILFLFLALPLNADILPYEIPDASINENDEFLAQEIRKLKQETSVDKVNRWTQKNIFVKDIGQLTEHTGVIMPFYVYPSNVFFNEEYNRLIDLKKKYHSVPLWVILNPENGPGTAEDGNYREAIRRLKGAGAVTLGYISTNYGFRASSASLSDIDTWKLLYPDIDGIFIDEYSNNVSTIPYYNTITDFGHYKGLFPMVANPGVILDTVYYASATADFWIVYESPGYPSSTTLAGDFDDGNFEFHYKQRGAIAYNVNFDPDQVNMMRRYTGMIFVTTDTVPNPWDGLSPDLDKLLSTLSVNEDISPATTTIQGHLSFSMSTPTIVSCGTGASVIGNDNAGQIDVGTSLSGSCTLRFYRPWVLSPSCMANNRTTFYPIFSSATTTILTFFATGTLTGNDVVDWQCMGRR